MRWVIRNVTSTIPDQVWGGSRWPRRTAPRTSPIGSGNTQRKCGRAQSQQEIKLQVLFHRELGGRSSRPSPSKSQMIVKLLAEDKPGCQRCRLKKVRPLIARPRPHKAIGAGVNVQVGIPSSHSTLIWVKTSNGALDIVPAFLDVGVYGGICRRREQGPGSFLSVTTGAFLSHSRVAG